MQTKAFNFFIVAMLLTMLSITGLGAFAASPPTVGSFAAPQNLTVMVKEWEDGSQYFGLKWTNPADILGLVRYWDEYGEAPLEYQIDVKVGDGAWRYDRGESLFGNSLHAGYDETGIFAVNSAEFNPISEGRSENVDIKSTLYSFRVRYAYLISNDEEEYYTYSPFSNTASSLIEEASKAGGGAKPEPQKAEIEKGADLMKPFASEGLPPRDGTTTREQAIALAARTEDQASEIKGTGAVNSNPNTAGQGSTSVSANESGKAANSGPIPTDLRAKLPQGFPQIPVAADAEFDLYLSEMLSRDNNIVIVYKSKQTLEALYNLYLDYLKDGKAFDTYKQSDGHLSHVFGFKDGWNISVAVSLSLGNWVNITAGPPREEY